MKYFKAKLTLYVKADDNEQSTISIGNKLIGGLKTIDGVDITADMDIETSGPRYRGKVLTPAQMDLVLAAYKDGEGGPFSVHGSTVRTASSLVKLGLAAFDSSNKGIELTARGTKLAEEMAS